MWLRLKIFIGYLVLIVLLAFTIFLLRDEQLKRNRLQTDEAELLHARNLAEQAYAGLLELATRAETVSVWGEEDLAGYRDKRTEVCRTLQELGPHIRSSSGQARIDSLCLLLEQKEQLLDSTMQTFDHLQRVGEIVSRKIPAIVSHVRQTAIPSVVSADSVRKPAPTNLWSRIFKRKKSKSAYLEQREKTEERPAEKRQRASTAGMLRSLSREVTDIQKAEEERLLLQMDLLYEKRQLSMLSVQLGDFQRKVSPASPEKWLDAQEVCMALGISKRCLQNHRDRGLIPYSNIGGKCFYKEADIRQILEEGLIKKRRK